jgi:hypothetical protein
MEPNVSDNSCLGLESIRVYKLHEKHLSAAWKNIIFRLPIKRAGKVGRQQPGSMYREDQQSGVIVVSIIVPGLAQWITLIYHQKDLSRPSRRSTWRTIGLHRLLALRDFEERGPASSHRKTQSTESVQDSGP